MAAHDERLKQRETLLRTLRLAAKKMPGAHRSLKAIGRMIRLNSQQLLKAYRPESVVAWRSFLVPTEILYATGITPFTPESTCAVISQSQAAMMEVIRRAEEGQYDLKLCTFLKSIIGSADGGLMPTPDLVVASSSFCGGINAILHQIARHYGCAFFSLNLPLHSRTPEDIEYVANQLRNLTKLSCEITGRSLEKVETETLPRAIELSNEAGRWWKEIEKLRQAIPSPMCGREALDFATALTQAWGSERIVEIYKLLHAELQERVTQKVAAVPDEKVRLLWLHLRPYYPNNLMGLVEDAGGAVVFEVVNYPARGDMDTTQPYRALASELLNNVGQYRTFSAKWEQDLSYIVEKFAIEGAVYFAHENCEWSKAIFPGVSNCLRSKNIPILTLSGDCLVRSRDELLETRIQAFLENLKAKKAAPLVSSSRKLHRVPNGRCAIGLDMGATTAKAVVLGEEKILGWSVFPTTPDNRSTAGKALEHALRQAGLKQEDCGRFVATGVGRHSVDSADERITEITCHTVGMQHVFPEVSTIIDIGGQDTKAILVKEMAFRMNDACAAGTGRFLEHMASALGVSIQDMERLDQFAEKPLLVSRVCATFAESEVVSLVARGSSIEEIIRGIHEAVADKVVTLLKSLRPDIVSPVAISGGVAMNMGIVRALERKIAQTILVPDNPQIIGALGAAVIASRALSHTLLPVSST